MDWFKSYLGNENMDLRTRGALSPLPQYVFMAWCLIKQRVRLYGVVLS